MPDIRTLRDSGLSRRGFIAGVGGIFAGAALAACSTGSSNTKTNASPVGKTGPITKGGTLSIAFYADLEGAFDPNQVYWIETRSLNRNFADSLTDQDPDTGEIVPWLAEKWTINADASEYVFTLRKGVTFSDGTTLNAAAVKTAFDGIVALGALSLLGVVYMRGYKSSTVVDDYTVKVTFDGPNAQFLQATSTTTLSILSPATYKKTPQQRAAGQVVASGLFTLDSYTAGQEVKLSRRKDYAWPSKLVKNQGAAYLDAISVTYIAEDSVRIGNLTSGDLDIAWPRLPITSADQQLVTQSGGVIKKRSLPGISDVLVPNVINGRPLSDVNVRKALLKAVDRKSYASTIFATDYPVVTSVLDSSTPGYSDTSSALALDVAGAKSLLDAAGWKTGSGGTRSKGGKSLSLTYLITTNSPGPQLLQDQLKQVGIDLQIKVVTAAQLTTIEASGDWDLTDDYYTRADPSVLGTIFDLDVVKSPPGAASQDAATHKRASTLFAQGLSTTDKTKRDAVYANLQSYFLDQVIAVPVFERVQVIGLSSKIQGFAWTSESFLRANDIWKST
jgi:peptide/nickel transport system substrate-binding protein